MAFRLRLRDRLGDRLWKARDVYAQQHGLATGPFSFALRNRVGTGCYLKPTRDGVKPTPAKAPAAPAPSAPEAPF